MPGGADAGGQGPAAALVMGTGQTGAPAPKRRRTWWKGWNLKHQKQSSGSEKKRKRRNGRSWMLWTGPLMWSLWRRAEQDNIALINRIFDHVYK